MRKKLHMKERGWLEGKATTEAKCLRNVYLKARARYSKAVKSAKRLISKYTRAIGTTLAVPKEVLEGTKENECVQSEETESGPALYL